MMRAASCPRLPAPGVDPARSTGEDHPRIDHAPIRGEPNFWHCLARLRSADAKTLFHYQADLSAGSLLLPESRVIARLLMSGADQAQLDRAIRTDNVLQKKSRESAIRQARLIRLRLSAIAPSTWRLIVDGDKEVATQLLFAAALKHSALLTAFLSQVVADHHRRLESHLSPHAWGPFLADCAAQDPQVSSWSESTRKKLLQVIIRILAEARYLETTRSLRLLPPHIHPKVRQVLAAAGETDLIGSLELQA